MEKLEKNNQNLYICKKYVYFKHTRGEFYDIVDPEPMSRTEESVKQVL